MRLATLAATALLGAGALLAAPASAANLVVNGSFEDGLNG